MKGWEIETAAWRRGAALFMCGIALLAAGVLVYVFDRPPGSVGFLPRALAIDGGILGPLAGPLPTFLHTAAFALMTAALLGRGGRGAGIACAAWIAVDALFEISQHPSFHRAFGAGMDGYFDPMDLLAAGLGGAAAYILMKRFSPGEGART